MERMMKIPEVRRMVRPPPLDHELGFAGMLTIAGGWGIGTVTGLLVALGTIWLLGVALSLPANTDLPPPLAILPWIVGTIIAVLVIGAAQWSLVQRHVPPANRLIWLLATALGGGLISLPPLVFSVVTPSTELIGLTAGLNNANLLLRAIAICGVAGSSAALGAGAGAVLSGIQWYVLRRHEPETVRWIAANSMGAALGVGVIILGLALLGAVLRPLGAT
jgi:hypothetical protein